MEFLLQLENTKTQQKVSPIKERLKAIKGNSSIKGIDAHELSLVPDGYSTQFQNARLFEIQWVYMPESPHDYVLLKNGRA